MAFQQLPDNRGMIYVPECRGKDKKHPCRDCFSCQWCTDERCQVCRQEGCCAKRSKKAKKDRAD